MSSGKRCRDVDDLPRAATFAPQAILDLRQWKGVAEMLAQLYEGESSGTFVGGASGLHLQHADQTG